MERTYQNPVYSGACPDPFVLKYCGEYWGYCTGFAPDGRCFGIVHSRDLLEWRFVGGALEPLPAGWPEYWAPEVTYANGHFYLYYSVGNEAYMELRVAVADQPAGPFLDSGHVLTNEQFAIDAHVFITDDGVWHLFYATDFLEHSHIGTGTVRARMRDPFTLAEPARPVTLPRYDWHVFDPQRASKGGVRWHTVEGPFVLQRKGLFYQMFSGGNWQNLTYGVSYALSDRIDPPGEWAQLADGEQVLPILRTIPGKVIGPGHNSVVRGPDNRQFFCIYHRWLEGNNREGEGSIRAGEPLGVESRRVMALDRLEWIGERLGVFGPSTTPQPVPSTPTWADFFDEERPDGLGEGWHCIEGQWAAGGGAARQLDRGGLLTGAACKLNPPAYLAEVSLRALDDNPAGSFGVSLGDAIFFLIECAGGGNWRVDAHTRYDRGEGIGLPLPSGFDPSAYHLLRVEVDEGRAMLSLDGATVRWSTVLPAGHIGPFTLRTNGIRAAFAGFAITAGWEHQFYEAGLQPGDLGWQPIRGDWQIADGLLHQRIPAEHALLVKGPPLESYELVVNACLEQAGGAGACYGFYPAFNDRDNLLVTVEQRDNGWALCWQNERQRGQFALPADFDPLQPQQFRFYKTGSRLALQLEALPLITIEGPAGPAAVGLYTREALAAFDMVRVTAAMPPNPTIAA